MIRLQKYLADAGVASRRKAEELILDGKVKVNDEIVDEMGVKIDPDKDKVEFNGKIVSAQNEKVYIALNKPCGYVSSTTSSQGKSVLELVNVPERVYPVGRLDKDASGLLILTNDGEYADHMMHPKYESEKEYVVTISRKLEKEDIATMERGMSIDGKKLQPVKVLSATDGVVRLVLKEGINRQVKKMMGRLGYRVRSLQRVRVGDVELGKLREGKYRFIKI